MSKTIDNRVVSMEFENSNFEQNVRTSMSTLDKLKQSLKFQGASKGLEEISSNARRLDFSPISNGIEAVKSRFSALEVAGVTAMVRITNAAITTGKNMMSALTIDPIRTGFSEYETQIGAIQTILANTASKGSNLQDVNRALDELNVYADKTIYNFTEMTRNIGTFTAAGVDLNKSVSSIKGIANLAAVSGSTSQQASTAMYQLSQALAAGKVQLMDWNSVVNAGMGGEVFQNALKRTARQMGEDVDYWIEKTGSFRESLTKGQWLTADILTETLTQLSGAYTEADLIAKGYTEDQAKEIVKLADTAVSAATEVKTFTQLWDTLKEAAQSGWTQSWETIVGDFGEAKDLLTSISNSVGDVINKSAEARNKVLSEGLSTGWKQILDQGVSDSEAFQEKVISVAKEHGVAVDDMIEKSGSFEKSLKEGWVTSDILKESISALAEETDGLSEQQLKEKGYTIEQIKSLRELNEKVKDGSINLDDFAKRMARPSGRENMIEGFKNVFESLFQVVGLFKESMREVFPALTGEQLYSFTEKFRKFSESLKLSDETIQKLKTTFKGFFSALDIVKQGIMAVLKPFGEFVGGGLLKSLGSGFLDVTASIGAFFTKLDEGIKAGDGFKVVSDTISKALKIVKNAIESVFNGFDGIQNGAPKIADAIGGIFGGIKKVVSPIIKWLRENVSMSDIFAGLAGGGIFIAAKKLGGVFDNVSEVIEKIKSLFEKTGDAVNIKDVLSSVKDSLASFQEGIKVASLLGIAVAVGILSHSIKTLSEISPGKIAVSLGAIAGMIKMLNIGFKEMSSTIKKYDSKGTLKASAAMMAMAQAIKMLADAVIKLKDVPFPSLVKGLGAIMLMTKALSSAMKNMNGSSINLRTSVALLAIAKSCQMLADAVKKFAELSWEDATKGLLAMGAALGELTLSVKALSKFGNAKSMVGAVTILLLTKSLDEIAENLTKLGNLSWGQITRGLTAMGGALGELVAATSILGKFGGMKSLVGATSIFLITRSLDEISESLHKLGLMSWPAITKGLASMGGALTELSATVTIVGRFGGFKSILGAVAIKIAVSTLDEISENLKKLSDLSWERIAKGLSAMGGALSELSLASALLGKLTGFSGLVGAVTIKIAVSTLDEISENLEKLSNLSWEEIARGLVAMGGALTELSIITGLFGELAGLSGFVGSISLGIAVQTLDEIASALSNLSALSWDDIARGLTAMGGALTELSLASGLLGNLGGLASIVGSGTILVAAQGLGDIADALVKFGDMSWDEIGRGLSAMAGALGETALGGVLNTLSGLGALSIAIIAEPLGALADSVKKWSGVSVPDNLGLQLAMLADGVLAFTFSGFGAGAISGVAEPLGIMADSVKKWSSVSVPENIGTNLGNLAEGVNSFTFSGFGAGAIEAVSSSLGTLADSVRKWAGISVPESIGKNLKSLASGVNEFSLSFLGGWSIDTVAGPLGTLADSVSKWSKVYIPERLKEGLGGLADGVKAFSWAFLGGFSLSAVVGPLGELATSVTKWNGVSIPDGLSTKLSGLADGIKSFNGVNLTNFSSGGITQAVENIKQLINTIGNISSINTEGLSSLQTAMDAIGKLSVEGLITSIQNGVQQVTPAVNQLIFGMATIILAGTNSVSQASSDLGKSVGNGISTGISSSTGGIQPAVANVLASVNAQISSGASSFNSAGNAIGNAISSGLTTSISGVAGVISGALSKAASSAMGASNNFVSVGSQISTSISSGLSNSSGNILTAINNTLNNALNAVNSKSGAYRQAGSTLGNNLVKGLRESASKAKQAVSEAISSALSGIKSHYSSFYSAGSNLAQGFANGISANSFAASAKASAMASAAAQAARRALDIHSPSRVMYRIGEFAGQGFVNALDTYRTKAYSASAKIANSARDGMRSALGNTLSLLDFNMDTNPKIKPVLDLSAIRNSSSQIGRLIDLSPVDATLTRAISIGDVSLRNQNDLGNKFAAAFNDLKKTIRGAGNTYVIDGITYDDGSNVSTAVESLIRAARVERRI